MQIRTMNWMPILALALAMAACDEGAVAPVLDLGGSDPADTIVPSDEGTPEDLGPRPDGAVCTPAETQCVGTTHKACKADGSGWTDTECERGTACKPEGCVETVCTPNAVECNDAGLQVVCNVDGSGYGTPTDCETGYECVSGQCLPEICTPGTTECTPTSILSCVGNPPEWVETPCAESEICFKGMCVECFVDAHCPTPLVCNDEGRCTAVPLTIVTDELPVGQIELAYAATLEAIGGTAPYAWALDSGTLPTGLLLASDGTLSGTPGVKGDFAIKIAVQDADGFSVKKDFTLTILDRGLAITSKSPLPDCEEGTPYTFTFQAIGGTQPYGWNKRAGTFPVGLSLSSEGTLSGTPESHGTFDFTVRVVDDQPTAAQGDFALTCKIAPLNIIGDQVFDLWIMKIVILPVITVIDPIPVPYSTQLQAKGGVKPYTWSETELSGLIKTFIPKAGIPQGLTLSPDGKLSGAVTDSSLVFELNIPFMNLPTLKGFFFMGQVVDSQSPADSDQAIFLIPTVAVNLGF